MLNLSNLSVSYGMHEALSSVVLSVAADEIVVILGANGAGKSSLLKAIAGVCEGQVAGEVTLGGQSLMGIDAAEIVEHGIAFVPEGRGIFGDLTVQENLTLGAFAEHARHKQHDNLDRVLSLFPKLAERQKQIARTMSGGEQQMVAIGRALMSAPSILMLDEPSLGLSPLLCKELFASLKQVRDTGVGILLVEQNARQSLGIADRGYLLENGTIIGEDSAERLLHDPAVQAAYLGGAAAKASVDSVNARTPITPRSTQAAMTAATASLAGEDIDSLVARASSAASRHASTVSTTSFIPAENTQAVAADRKLSEIPKPVTHVVLPEAHDTDVQRMLAEFEEAALRASSGSRSKATTTKAASSSRPTAQQNDDHYLPHIPVYRKNAVTVYRRDSAGILQKQEKP